MQFDFTNYGRQEIGDEPAAVGEDVERAAEWLTDLWFSGKEDQGLYDAINGADAADLVVRLVAILRERRRPEETQTGLYVRLYHALHATIYEAVLAAAKDRAEAEYNV